MTTLKSLERTANIIAPCQSPNSSSESGALCIDEKRRISSNGPIQQHPTKSETINNRLEINKSPYSRPQIVTTNIEIQSRNQLFIKREDVNLIENKNSDLKFINHYSRNLEKSEKSESIIDEEEEEEIIDVVRIDGPCDPMWRPW